jgi:hypothetical protein
MSAEDAAGNRWLYAIRVRVLSFLLARYGEAGPAPGEPAGTGEQGTRPEPARRTYCIVEKPQYHPPRAYALLAATLRDVARCNAAARRWRFWP